jgi:hypothetical protein
MEGALRLVASVAILSNVPLALAARITLRKTTLLGAWVWAAFALAVWTLTFFASEVLGWLSEGAADQAWLAAAVLLICPFVAVLGARRPGSRVWDVFIVAPLAVVLDLPAVTAWNRDFSPAPLHLEVPMLAGYGLVLLMGTGNYLGTRFVIPVLLAAVAGLLVPLSMSSLHWLPESFPTRAAATLLLAIAIWTAFLAMRKARRGSGGLKPSRIPMREGRVTAVTPFDALWSDFRDLYGIVWARRVLDRVNVAATEQNWSVRLQLQGFVATDPSHSLSLTNDQLRQIEHTLRWLLRRFADAEWIDARIVSAGRAV